MENLNILDSTSTINKLFANTAGTATTAVVGSYLIKRMLKKELLPVSSWKQALFTFLTISASGAVNHSLNSYWERENIKPRPK